MNKSGLIVFIDDDEDDQSIITEIFKELNYPNKVLIFPNGEDALTYLTKPTTEEPFIIISDVNMPKLNGLELMGKIRENQNQKIKWTPFLLFSTSAQQEHLVNAYSKCVQGFFVKSHDYEKIKSSLKKIMDYWLECVSPDYNFLEIENSGRIF